MENSFLGKLFSNIPEISTKVHRCRQIATHLADTAQKIGQPRFRTPVGAIHESPANAPFFL